MAHIGRVHAAGAVSVDLGVIVPARLKGRMALLGRWRTLSHHIGFNSNEPAQVSREDKERWLTLNLREGSLALDQRDYSAELP